MPDLERNIIIIPNTIEPYGYELIKIIAYPKGFKYRFRFDEEWVDTKVSGNIKDLTSKTGVIVFRDFKEAKFYPIRYFKLLKAQKIGKIYYFEYELSDFIDYDSDSNWRSEQINKINEEFTRYHSTTFANNTASNDMKPLVLLSNYSFEDIKNEHYCSSNTEEKEHEQWGNIVTLIKNISFYENVEFIKILDVVSMSQNGGSAIFTKDYLRLLEAHDYKLRILQFIPKGGKQKAEPRDIEIKSDDKYISIVRGKERAVGKYDVLTFVFRTNERSGGHNSFIDIEHTPKSEGKQYIEPKLFIPVSILKSMRIALIKIALGAIFVGLYIYLNIFPDSKIIFLKDVSIIGTAIIIHELLFEIKDFIRQR